MFWELRCRDSWWLTFNACPSGGNLPLCLAASLGTSNSWPLENQALSLGFYRFCHKDSQKELQHIKVVWISALSSEEGRFVASEFYLWKKKSHPGCLLRPKGKNTLFPTPCLFQVADSFPASSSLSSTSFPGLQHQFMTSKKRNVFSYSSGSQTPDIHLARLCFLEEIHPHLFYPLMIPYLSRMI